MRAIVAALAVIFAARSLFANDLHLYAEMSPEELRQVITKHPVAYIPAGINEWHGEQSACGLDALKAETLARMAARQLGGVCFPTIWTGPGNSTPFDPTQYPRGTLTIDKELYLAAAEELLTKIEAMGFKVAVYLSGHYPGIIPSVAEKFNGRSGMKVLSASENMVVKGIPAGDHAAAWETAVLMALRPGLVDLSRLPPLPPTTRPAGLAIPEPWPFKQRCEYYGIYGADPRIWANTHFGRVGVEAVIDGLAREVSLLLGDDNYGKERGPIEWPTDGREQPEVRYDFLLPYAWMGRFERAPIVYWPLPVIGESIEEATRRAMRLAVETGGMVFPAFPYGPGGNTQAVSVSRERFAQITAEVVRELAGMDFRVVVLMPGAGLDAQARERLSDLKIPHGQGRIIVARPSDGAALPDGLDAAIRATIPRRGDLLSLDENWKAGDAPMVFSLSEAIYTPPGETRVYEQQFELTAAQAGAHALLDLGKVENLCEVFVNDAPALKDHWPPYRFLVTGRLKPGINHLKVAVKRQPQPTLDGYFYQPGLPRLAGPVVLRLWEP